LSPVWVPTIQNAYFGTDVDLIPSSGSAMRVPKTARQMIRGPGARPALSGGM
jgi:hypothetical protein